MDRYRLKLGGGKRFGENLGVKVSLRHEEKRGERLWGTQGFNFITEPIDFTTQEVQGAVSYSMGKLQLSGGYLGSFFKNDNKVVNNDGGVSEVSLPLDNQAHQLFLSGAYTVSPSTRINGKIAYSIALQNENFYTAPTFTGNTRSGLDGRVDTLLAQLGGTSRPLPKLTLNARLRYEYRDDKTVQAQYVTEDPERSGFNTLTSRTTASGDFNAGYQLPMDFHLTAGVKVEHWDREIPTKRQVSWQAQTNEASYSVGLRRRLTDTLGGSAGFIYSLRNGSGSIADTASPPSNRIDAILWADRERAKWRLALDWTPLNQLSMQLIYEESADEYNNRSLGPRDGSSRHITVDGNYRVNDDWNVNAWATLLETKIDQATNGDSVASAGTNLIDWQADLRQLGKSVGLGVRGQAMAKVKVGGNIQFTEDVAEHKINGFPGNDSPDLPDIRYRQGSLNAFAEYAVTEQGKVRLNYNFIRTVARDWTWSSWVYADGTQVTIPTQEDNHFIGLSYTHKW
jgi:MtrB/PioB family decaheme-associated outer membrane protein